MSHIQLQISELLLRSILRLPNEVTLEAAAIADGAPVLLLTVNMPDAPREATAVDLTYMILHDIPDPIRLAGMRYTRADGTEIT